VGGGDAETDAGRDGTMLSGLLTSSLSGWFFMVVFEEEEASVGVFFCSLEVETAAAGFLSLLPSVVAEVFVGGSSFFGLFMLVLFSLVIIGMHGLICFVLLA
jgi:hypothetical protein